MSDSTDNLRRASRYKEYLSSIDEQIIFKVTDDIWPAERVQKLHETYLDEEIEKRTNEFIAWKVFGEMRIKLYDDDAVPAECFDNVWVYVHYHILRYIKVHHFWFEHKMIDKIDSKK